MSENHYSAFYINLKWVVTWFPLEFTARELKLWRYDWYSAYFFFTGLYRSISEVHFVCPSVPSIGSKAAAHSLLRYKPHSSKKGNTFHNLALHVNDTTHWFQLRFFSLIWREYRAFQTSHIKAKLRKKYRDHRHYVSLIIG